MVDPVMNRIPVGDLDLDVNSFKKLSDFIQKKTGLSLSKSKGKDFKTIFSQLMVLSSCENIDQFYRAIIPICY